MLAILAGHCSAQSVLALAPDNVILRLNVSQSFSCSSHQTRAFGVDARRDMETLTSIYVNSDDTAKYALAW